MGWCHYESILHLRIVRHRSQSLGETDTSARDPVVEDDDDTLESLFHASVVCVSATLQPSGRLHEATAVLSLDHYMIIGGAFCK